MSTTCRYISLLQAAMLLYGVTAEHCFVVQPAEIIAIEGMSVQLQCKVSYTSHEGQTYSIGWKYNNLFLLQEIQSKYDIKETYFDRNNGIPLSTLTIVNVTREDEGLYRCCLLSKSGPQLSTGIYASVTVILKPVFTRQPHNISVTEGQPTTLPCRIDGLDSNTMSVKWTKGVSEVAISDINATSMARQDARYSIIGDNVKAFHLQIRSTTRSDAGMFCCRVQDRVSGQVILDSRRAMLDVLFPPNEDYPLCVVPESKNFSEGDILTTECISKGGNGPIYLSWLRNGEEINGTRLSNENPDIRHMWTLTAVDNGANITCVMKGTAVPSRRECAIGPLDVYFQPMVSTEPKSMQVSVVILSLVVGILFLVFAVIVLVCVIFRHRRKTVKYGNPQSQNQLSQNTSFPLTTEDRNERVENEYVTDDSEGSYVCIHDYENWEHTPIAQNDANGGTNASSLENGEGDVTHAFAVVHATREDRATKKAMSDGHAHYENLPLRRGVHKVRHPHFMEE